jgi:phage N-6-adenine-methyltransferase
MTISSALYSNRTDEWPTPRSFFAQLNAEFNFTLDPCASAKNTTCRTFSTKEQDGLKQDWKRHRVVCNPPYGKTMREWARKCYEASRRGALVVLLAHARTDTRWFHDWVYGKAHEIRFVRGRLKFGDGTQSAPFTLHGRSLLSGQSSPLRARWSAAQGGFEAHHSTGAASALS